MKKIIVPYDSVKFKFIESHWDVHLMGLCYYENSVCEFITIKDDAENCYENPICEIRFLSFIEKIKKLFKQKLFEFFVGTHWSYKKNGKISRGSYGKRKPKFFWTLMVLFYYKCLSKKRRE